MLRNSKKTYGSAAKFFHWLIFLLIAGLLTVGYIMTDMELSPDKFKLIGLHKALGIMVLTLALVRLVWRLINVVPELPAHMSLWERVGAHLSHWGLYALMIAMPLSGWLMSSASGFTVSIFGWFNIPNLIAPDKVLAGNLRDLHELLAYAIIGVVILHAMAALLHHFYYKDNILRRMLPFTKEENHYARDQNTGC